MELSPGSRNDASDFLKTQTSHLHTHSRGSGLSSHKLSSRLRPEAVNHIPQVRTGVENRQGLTLNVYIQVKFETPDLNVEAQPVAVFKE